ncbi:MAG: hypothetical protein RR356_00270 [Bacteroidales bacterium]
MKLFKEFIILNIILPIADLVLHTHLFYWYKKINKMLRWSPDKIKCWQIEKLQQLIHHAYNNTVYYHELFDSLGLKPEDIRTIEDLEKIPPLTKDIIRNRYDDIIPKNIHQFHYHHSSTGGSTGEPTKYIKDNNSWGFDNAFNIIAWKQTGYRYGDKFMALGSSSIFPTNKKSILHHFYYKLKGKIPFNAMNLSEEVLHHYVNFLSKHKIHYIYGYASSIYILAKFIEDNHLQKTINIKACFPTSEILTETYKNTIERVFHCLILDSYGANDGGIIAHQFGDGFKVGYNSIAQLITNQSTNFGTELLTDVTNLAFPFIRYQLGDEVEIGDGYSDKYNGQIFNRVMGRTSDIIMLENGKILTGPGFTILFKDLNVIGYRIFKSNPLELTLEIVKGSGYNQEQEDLIEETMHKHAGKDCKIIINYLTEMKKRNSGKSLFFMN